MCHRGTRCISMLHGAGMCCYRCDSDVSVDEDTGLCSTCTKQVAKWTKDKAEASVSKEIRLIDDLDLWSEV